MPGELNNPENLFPFHYDPKYEPGTNTFESRPLNIKDMIQSIARKLNGAPLNKEGLISVQDYLFEKNLLHRNPGDQIVQETVEKRIKILNSSKRVARRSPYIQEGFYGFK